MQEMKGRFDRLVRELGVSPRGPPPSGTSKFNTASSPRLPKVPSSKAWGSTPRHSKKKGAADFLPRRSGGAGVVLPPASGARRGSRGSSAASELRGPAEVVAFARLVGRLDTLVAEGSLSAEQATRLRALGTLQSALSGAAAEDDAALAGRAQQLADFIAGGDFAAAPAAAPPLGAERAERRAPRAVSPGRARRGGCSRRGRRRWSSSRARSSSARRRRRARPTTPRCRSTSERGASVLKLVRCAPPRALCGGDKRDARVAQRV